MNDIAKKSISEKFTKALQTEKMQVKDAARMLHILPAYASMILHEKNWDRCAKSAWEVVLTWINSGQTLKQYAQKHGHVLPVTPAPGVKELTPEEKALQGVPFKMDEEPRTEMTPEEKEMLRDSMFPLKKESAAEEERRLIAAIKSFGKSKEDFIQPIDPDPALQRTETTRLKVCLDIEINLVINGQKVQVK